MGTFLESETFTNFDFFSHNRTKTNEKKISEREIERERENSNLGRFLKKIEAIV